MMIIRSTSGTRSFYERATGGVDVTKGAPRHNFGSLPARFPLALFYLGELCGSSHDMQSSAMCGQK
jgi:hypothetical protein